jgi:hypothetical protein
VICIRKDECVQVGPDISRNHVGGRRTLQRSEFQTVMMVVSQQKIDRAVAQSANAVKEDDGLIVLDFV